MVLPIIFAYGLGAIDCDSLTAPWGMTVLHNDFQYKRFPGQENGNLRCWAVWIPSKTSDRVPRHTQSRYVLWEVCSRQVVGMSVVMLLWPYKLVSRPARV